MPRYAIKTPPQHSDWESILTFWREADDIDLFETAWNFDHFYPLYGDTRGPCMEAWVTLAALAQATNRIRIGCMVHGMHYRHPAVTANMAASLDLVSGGRLDLGLGAGWFEPESEAYGIELGTLKERFDRFDEGVQVIVDLLTKETTTFDGEFYRLTDAYCEPKPVQRPHPPIVIGGTGERRTLAAVARHAQMWDALRITPDEWLRKRDVLAAHCQHTGRDIDEITTSSHLMFSVDSDMGELAEEAEALGEVGVDVVVFSMRAPFEVRGLEALTAALDAAG
jgi:F420-dependent oxidoreductase-like protein